MGAKMGDFFGVLFGLSGEGWDGGNTHSKYIRKLTEINRKRRPIISLVEPLGALGGHFWCLWVSLGDPWGTLRRGYRKGPGRSLI